MQLITYTKSSLSLPSLKFQGINFLYCNARGLELVYYVTTPATPLIKAYQCGFFYA